MPAMTTMPPRRDLTKSNAQFARAVRRLLGYTTKSPIIEVPETATAPPRQVIARAFPISIDVEGFEQLARSPEVQERARQIRSDLGDPKIVILDVRTKEEYDAGHIPNAKLLPLGQLETLAAEALPDRNATLLVYCRSGRRSNAGAETLVSLGYTDVRDFGGIIDWPYDVVTD